MRIIAGKAGGRKLKSIKKSQVRPTLDRVKEALFSMITPYLKNAEILDLFSGFGGLGLEAISRGAEKAVLVEKNRKNVSVIKENIKICNFEEKINLVNADVFQFLDTTENKFDIILMDPPYAKRYGRKVLNIIIKNNILKDKGIIVIEHSTKEQFKAKEKASIIREKKYGDTALTIFQYREEK